jgi:hypothetical protein
MHPPNTNRKKTPGFANGEAFSYNQNDVDDSFEIGNLNMCRTGKSRRIVLRCLRRSFSDDVDRQTKFCLVYLIIAHPPD